MVPMQLFRVIKLCETVSKQQCQPLYRSGLLTATTEMHVNTTSGAMSIFCIYMFIYVETWTSILLYVVGTSRDRYK